MKRTLPSPVNMSWRACCLALLALTVLAGCTETPQESDPPIPCDARAILATNPATGECEWISSCDDQGWAPCATDFRCDELPPDACGLDDRCETESTTVCTDCLGPGCGCNDTVVCKPKDPPAPCEGLQEDHCLAAQECAPRYGWVDEDIGCPDTPGGPIDGGAEPLCAPIDREPVWTYIGCFPAPPQGCQGLGEDACLSDADCEPVYSTQACNCDGAAPLPPGDDSERPGCLCEDVPVFDHCTDAQPDTCDEADTYDECLGLMGCRWNDGYDGQPMPEPFPCECDSSDPNCDCAGDPIDPSPGFCEQDPGSSCWDLYDENSCNSTEGCTWDWYDGTQPDPAPPACDCDPNDPTCDCGGLWYPGGECRPDQPQSCADYGDEYSCTTNPDCDWYMDDTVCVCPEGEPCDCLPEPGGYCDDRRTTTTCYDYYDEFSCSDNPECQWNYLDGMEPIPFCDPADPNCGGAPPQEPPADGYCTPRQTQPVCDYGDSMSCSSDPGCEWVGSQDGDECMVDENGNCIDGIPAPPPDECWGAWVDEAGVCRSPNDGTYPDYCCDGLTNGYCQPLPDSPGCGAYEDEFSCSSAGCSWRVEVFCMDCDPAAPDCMSTCEEFGYCSP